MHADRLPASQPLCRYGYQRRLFEMVLWTLYYAEDRAALRWSLLAFGLNAPVIVVASAVGGPGNQPRWATW